MRDKLTYTDDLSRRDSMRAAGTLGVAAAALSLPIQPLEADSMTALTWCDHTVSGCNLPEATRSQTIGYALADSPVGQA
jgi:hypothetical protein